MINKMGNQTLRLKRYAVQIATQLPENRDEALQVLDYVRELVEWEATVGDQIRKAALTLIG